jgi:hypothetical protein
MPFEQVFTANAASPRTWHGLALLRAFNASTSFSALTIWSFSAYAFPAYLIILNILLFFAAYKNKLVSLLKKTPQPKIVNSVKKTGQRGSVPPANLSSSVLEK